MSHPSPPTRQSDSRSGPALRRGLNLPLLLLYGVGNILGAGIYVLVGEVTAIAGYHAPIAFLAAALIAGITGVTYVELSSRYPLSAGEAVYVDEGFGRRRLSALVGLLVCASGTISSATLARGFVGYLQIFLDIPEPLVILVLLAVLGAVAIIGIVESVGVAALFTLLEAGGLLLIIWVGRDSLATLPTELPNLVPGFEAGAWIAIFSGAFLSFFAFIGFEDMVNVAEEVKNPRKTLPRAILLALVICTILYGSISLVAVLQVGPGELAGSPAPLALIYERATGSPPVFIGVLGLFAIVNGVLIQLIMVSRIIYGMARKNWIPPGLGAIHQRFRTPARATVLVLFLILGFALFLPLVSLATITSLLVLLVFTLVNASLIAIKLKRPSAPDATLVPMAVPIIGVISALGLATLAIGFL